MTVLAGSKLLGIRQGYQRTDRLAPFLEGVVILDWATATFWFPVMITIGIWRHLVKPIPLRYHPAYWVLVFPIGMDGVATYKMIATTGLSDLDLLPQLALAMALAAWTAAFLGLVWTLARSASPTRRAT
jgi:tellurite resistance protein TehA-like permease